MSGWGNDDQSVRLNSIRESYVNTPPDHRNRHNALQMKPKHSFGLPDKCVSKPSRISAADRIRKELGAATKHSPVHGDIPKVTVGSRIIPGATISTKTTNVRSIGNNDESIRSVAPQNRVEKRKFVVMQNSSPSETGPIEKKSKICGDAGRSDLDISYADNIRFASVAKTPSNCVTRLSPPDVHAMHLPTSISRRNSKNSTPNETNKFKQITTLKQNVKPKLNMKVAPEVIELSGDSETDSDSNVECSDVNKCKIFPNGSNFTPSAEKMIARMSNLNRTLCDVHDLEGETTDEIPTLGEYREKRRLEPIASPNVTPISATATATATAACTITRLLFGITPKFVYDSGLLQRRIMPFMGHAVPMRVELTSTTGADDALEFSFSSDFTTASGSSITASVQRIVPLSELVFVGICSLPTNLENKMVMVECRKELNMEAIAGGDLQPNAELKILIPRKRCNSQTFIFNCVRNMNFDLFEYRIKQSLLRYDMTVAAVPTTICTEWSQVVVQAIAPSMAIKPKKKKEPISSCGSSPSAKNKSESTNDLPKFHGDIEVSGNGHSVGSSIDVGFAARNRSLLSGSNKDNSIETVNCDNGNDRMTTAAFNEILGLGSYANGSRSSSRLRRKNLDPIVHLLEDVSSGSTSPLRRPSRAARKAKALIPIGDDVGDNDVILRYPMEENAVDVITLTKGDLRRLHEGEYLNDNIIDFSIKHMIYEARADSNDQYNRQHSDATHAFSCHFYTQLLQYHGYRVNDKAYSGIERWTKNVNLFNKEFIFIPINKHVHWSLFVVIRPGVLIPKEYRLKFGMYAASASASSSDITGDGMPSIYPENETHNDAADTCTILHFDSLRIHNTNSIGKQLKQYLGFEFTRKWFSKYKEYALKEYPENELSSVEILLQDMHDSVKKSIDEIPVLQMKSVPSQPNGVDCGVYVTEYASLVYREWPSSTEVDRDNQFVASFHKDSFNHDDIVTKRVKIKSLIEGFRDDYAKIVEERQEKRRIAKEKKRARLKEKANSDLTGILDNGGSQSFVSPDKSHSECAGRDGTSSPGSGSTESDSDSNYSTLLPQPTTQKTSPSYMKAVSDGEKSEEDDLVVASGSVENLEGPGEVVADLSDLLSNVPSRLRLNNNDCGATDGSILMEIDLDGKGENLLPEENTQEQHQNHRDQETSHQDCMNMPMEFPETQTEDCDDDSGSLQY